MTFYRYQKTNDGNFKYKYSDEKQAIFILNKKFNFLNMSTLYKHIGKH